MVGVLGVVLLSSTAWSQDTGASDDWEDEYFTIDGYRIMHYSFPTPEAAEGGATVHVAELEAMRQDGKPLVLVDVQPTLFRSGRFIWDEPHRAIAGSYWLPNVGHGDLLPEWLNYLSDFMRTQTAVDPEVRIVFYCTANCWMSWNAVKRVSEMGYSHIAWFKDGIEAWEAAGLPMEAVAPVPRS